MLGLGQIARQEGLSKSGVGRHRDHSQPQALSHLRTARRGTADTGYHQGQPPQNVQLDLLALAAEGEDFASLVLARDSRYRQQCRGRSAIWHMRDASGTPALAMPDMGQQPPAQHAQDARSLPG